MKWKKQPMKNIKIQRRLFPFPSVLIRLPVDFHLYFELYCTVSLLNKNIRPKPFNYTYF